MSSHQTPVEIVIEAFGSATAVAKAIGRSPAAVSRWRSRGRIPSKVQQLLLDAAKVRGIDLTCQDIVQGRASATG